MWKEPEPVRRLYDLRNFGIKPGLDRIQALLERLGNPERNFTAIHVAGTNGKGSVCAMIESVLRSAGYTTGLYTSPHLVRLNERMCVNGECISDDELVELIAFVEEHAPAVSKTFGDVTFFEFTTALAFEYFRRKKVQIVVTETGMGGRLDATNVIKPLVSVITRISREHTAYLGSTVGEISGEKCGIIKPGTPVVCGDMEIEAFEVVERVAREMKARFIVARDVVSVRRISQDLAGQKISVVSGSADYSSLVLPLLGRHQLENCAIAVAAAEEIGALVSGEMDPDAVKKGLRKVEWPARCEVLSTMPLVLLDGAHNPGAAEALAVTVKELARGRPVGLVLGMCSDKDHGGFMRPFSRMVKRCWTVPIENERSMPRDKLAALAGSMGWRVSEADLPDAIAESKKWAADNDALVCITGSLYLAGEVLSLRKRNINQGATDN